MNDVQSIIISNVKIADGVFSLQLEADIQDYISGQFIMLEVPGFFLRRPFGIADIKDNQLKIIYKIAGDGTEKLSKMRAGESVNILGPLGNGFGEDAPDACVAGGYGVVPFYGLIRKIFESGSKIKMFYGGAKKESLFVLDELSSWSDLHITTDDGSLGEKCIVTDLLKKDNWLGKRIFACGPMQMLKCLSDWAKDSGAIVSVSVEARMGCGWGACLGCAVPKVDGGYYHACKDGPVFSSTEIDWEKLG